MKDLSRRGFGALALSLAAVAAGGTAAADEPLKWRAGFRTPPDGFGGEMKLASGRLPGDLEGSLFRAGPAQFERAGERLGHWFDGDGMVQSFQMSGGVVRHKGRFVSTYKRQAEERAGKFKYAGYGFAPLNAAPFTKPDEINAANTSILPVGSEIWALWEGGSPWRINTESLETIDRQKFPGELDGLIFSAHPKQEPNGDIWNFGGFGSRCLLWHLAKDGSLIRATSLQLPASTLMHDFAVTSRHLVLLAPPLVEVARPATSLIDRFDWRPDLPLRAIILDKNDFSVRRVYELPAQFLYHIGNAWEDEAGVIRIDACLAQDAAFATKVARELPGGRFSVPPYARPTLITLHPDGRFNISGMDDVGEFPKTDPRRVGSRHRFTWTVLADGIARWDWDGGPAQRFRYGDRYWPEEPLFVPRPGSTAEDSGWIVTTRLDMLKGRTELLVFDAQDISDGPCALFESAYAVPLGFHGAFVDSRT